MRKATKETMGIPNYENKKHLGKQGGSTRNIRMYRKGGNQSGEKWIMKVDSVEATYKQNLKKSTEKSYIH